MEPHVQGLALADVARGTSGAAATRDIAATGAVMGLATATRYPTSRSCRSSIFRRTGCAGTELPAPVRSTGHAARGGSGVGVERDSVPEIVVLSLGNVTRCKEVPYVSTHASFHSRIQYSMPPFRSQ